MTDAALAGAAREIQRSRPHREAASARASVALDTLATLWINTGTLCNITCLNCYIESSPENDRLAYITRAEVARFLDEIAADGLPVREIGFTGGEPFMNPDMLAMLEDALGARLRGAGADQRHAADAAPAHPRRAARRCASAYGDAYLCASASTTTLRRCTRRSAARTHGTRRSRASTGSPRTASRWRSPAAPAGTRAKPTRGPATPR